MSKQKENTNSMWGGRFSLAPSEIMEKINASIDFDKKLYNEDIDGSITHCKMLAKQGIITQDESKQILKELEEIRQEIKDNRFNFSKALEDFIQLPEKYLFY